MHLSSHDLHEAIRERGRARDILENEHFTRIVGLTIATLIDEAADPRYAADRKRLEAIARYVKENWQKVPVRDDANAPTCPATNSRLPDRKCQLLLESHRPDAGTLAVPPERSGS